MPTSDRFIDERKGAWQRLEDLLKLLDRSSLKRLHREVMASLAGEHDGVLSTSIPSAWWR